MWNNFAQLLSASQQLCHWKTMKHAFVLQDTLKLLALLLLIAGLTVESTFAVTMDIDGDGVVDTVDQDDDNDGIPDRWELFPNGAERDTDGDGMPDRMDLDSDNDGILDVQESGVFMSASFGSARIVNGRILAQVGENGLANFLETFVDSNNPIYQLQNTDEADGDIVPDYLDLDSDNDGLSDLLEAGLPASLDQNRDGRIDAPPGSVGADGIFDAAQLHNDASCCDYDDDGIEDSTPFNTDTGDLPDFQDLDSDNDGVLDLVEGGGTDLDQDGRIDSFFDDANSPDGVDDGLALVPLSVPDSNGNGIPDFRDASVQYTAAPVPDPVQPVINTPAIVEPPVDPQPADPAIANPTGSLAQEPVVTAPVAEPAPGAATPSPPVDDNPIDAPLDDGVSDPDGFIATGLAGGSGCSLNPQSRLAGSDVSMILLLLCSLGFFISGARRRVATRVSRS